ncbi:YibE/F family protein [Lapidilactobacillus gannanensis]|uniref:YibE/F family protein n=1 Tax=Lapidilactobacillus gannanensis TaxID=2486002 RepID=A0ABW4BKV7_9LACO|nr:YibE/F family protein [Lapidilactobacillus gannanensis]
MSSLSALLLTLLVLICLVGGTAGLKSYLSIIINFLLIFFVALLISWGANIWFTIVCFVPLKLLTIIYLGTHDTKIADRAFISSLIVTGLIAIVILGLDYSAQAIGVGDQTGEDLIGMSTAPGLNYGAIGILVALFSTLGAISEAAVAMSTGLIELKKQNKELSQAAYWQSAQNIGQDILGTAINTILFGFFGSCLALFIWFTRLHYTLSQIANDKLFVQEALIIVDSIIGVLLIVPLATWVVNRGSKKN